VPEGGGEQDKQRQQVRADERREEEDCGEGEGCSEEQRTPASTGSPALSARWLGLGLRTRRSSMLHPMRGCRNAGPEGLEGVLLHQRQQGRAQSKRDEYRLAVLRELLRDLAEYYNEIDEVGGVAHTNKVGVGESVRLHRRGEK